MAGEWTGTVWGLLDLYFSPATTAVTLLRRATIPAEWIAPFQITRRAELPIEWTGTLIRKSNPNQQYKNLVFYDSFTDPVVHDIAVHGPDIGVNWRKLSTAASIIQTNGGAANRAVSSGSGLLRYVANPQPGDDQRIEGVIAPGTTAGTPGGLLLRSQTNADGYAATLAGDGTFQIAIPNNSDPALWTVLASTVVAIPNPLTIKMHFCTFQAFGRFLTATLSSPYFPTVKLEAQDTTYTTGFAGLVAVPISLVPQWDTIQIFDLLPYGLAIEWQGTLPRRGQTPVEWAGSLGRRATIPVEWQGVIPRRALIPVEWQGQIRRRAEIPLE